MQFVIFIFYLWAFFAYGLYFSNHVFPFVMMLAFTTGAIMVYEWIRGHKSSFNIWLLPLPFLYLIPLIFGQFESVQGTLNQVIVMSMFVTISYLLLKVKREKAGDRKLQQIITIVSWSILFTSYAVLHGLFSFQDFVMMLSGSVSGLGERLGGFLQYPNAYAALLASMMLYHLLVAIDGGEVRHFLTHAALLPGIFCLLLLTESRGAWLLFAISYFLSLFFVSGEKQLRYLVLTLYVGLSGLLLYGIMTYLGSIKASILSIFLLCLFSGMIYFLRPGKWEFSVQYRGLEKLVPFIVPLGSILLGLDILCKGLVYRLLPVSLQNRFSFGTGTLTDRFYYWHDVWRNLSTIGFFGRGGDGWAYLMHRVQSYPYLTSEIHSSVIDVYIETGMIALVLVILIVIFACRNLWKNKSVEFPAFLFLIMHSLIDFTFSYPVMVLWLLLLYMAGSTLNIDIKKKHDLQPKFPAIVMIVVLLGSFTLSLKFMKAEQSYLEGIKTNNIVEAAVPLLQAVEWNSWQTRYTSVLVEEGFLQPGEAKMYLEEAIKYEPGNARLHDQLAEIYDEMGYDKEAEKEYDLVLIQDHYDTEKYERVLSNYKEKEKAALKAGKLAEANRLHEKANDIYERAVKLEKDMRNERLTNQRNFHVTEEMKKSVY